MMMKLPSNQLEAFYAVAQTRSFTKAAETLHISQSALSQRIINLEIEIQTPLFIRDRVSLELTAVAHELLKYCQFQESFENEFLGKLKTKSPQELAGIIRVAGFSSVMRSVITPSLRNLIIKSPNIQLDVQTKELHELLPLLRNGQSDYIITDQAADREGIECLKLGIERNILIEPQSLSVPNFFLDHDEKDEISRQYLKMVGKDSSKLRRHFLDDIYGIIDGVQSGLGKAVVPLHLISGKKGIVIKNPRKALETDVFVLFHKQPFYTQLHRAVIDSLVSVAGNVLK
jgi:DNA-binding transcriptional LysR family regulator